MSEISQIPSIYQTVNEQFKQQVKFEEQKKLLEEMSAKLTALSIKNVVNYRVNTTDIYFTIEFQLQEINPAKNELYERSSHTLTFELLTFEEFVNKLPKNTLEDNKPFIHPTFSKMDLFYRLLMTEICKILSLTAVEYEFDSDNRYEYDNSPDGNEFKYHVHFLMLKVAEKYVLVNYWYRRNECDDID